MKTIAMPLLALVAISTTLIGGCSTLVDARNAKGKGRSRTYEATFEHVWDEAKIAVADTGLTIASENKEEGYILAQ